MEKFSNNWEWKYNLKKLLKKICKRHRVGILF